ncbi:DNA repair protein rad10 [Neoconidiobolus thromboides FSU 785]|nr:DNA repair protein rad10 [Neoconidiobolus thromboides FSU 785]
MNQQNSASTSKPGQTTYPPKPKSTSSIQVHPNQRGNPLLQYIRSCPWTWAEIDINRISDNFPDYLVGKGHALLFLSLKYHKIHPEYIYNRLNLISGYKLTVILCQIDIPDHQDFLKELHQLSFNSSATLFLCWSSEEAGRYIECFKVMENKSPDFIQSKVAMDQFDSPYLALMNESLTKVRSVNKTDVLTLASTFGSFGKLAFATKQQLSLCPGLGDKKVSFNFYFNT